MEHLSPVVQRFILHWGEMGTRWGINRTVAQIHALLFISENPLHAEAICETLGVARSNVSNSLRELQNWGIVKVVHLPGDRRDHFTSLKDVYEMFRIILEQRKKREMDPTLAVLRSCVDEAGADKSTDPDTQERLKDLLEFFELTTAFYDNLAKLPTTAAVRALRTGDKILKTLTLAK